MKYINMTGQTIVLNSGEEFPVEQDVEKALVKETIGEFVDNVAIATIEDLTALPEQRDGVRIIVSRPYLAASRQAGINRDDIVCAATFHPDTKRDPENGRIISVPGFLNIP